MAEVIRVVKNRNYTTMGNFHLREKGLSYKAMGLMSYMLSMPDDWDYTIKGLAKCANDGIDSVRSALNELERFGFLERPGRKRDEKGRYRESVYVIYEEPLQVPETEKRYESGTATEDGYPIYEEEPVLENPTLDTPVEVAEILENTEKDDTPPVEGNPTLENPTLDNKIMVNPSKDISVSGNPMLENPILGNSVQENPTQLNTNILNTNIINTNILNQCAREAAQNNGQNREDNKGQNRGMYFPESKEVSDAFRDFVHMRRRKGGGVMTDRAIALTKEWIRNASMRDGRFDTAIAVDILNYSTMYGFSKLYTLEERNRQFRPRTQDFAEKSPSYEGKGEKELEEALLAN